MEIINPVSAATVQPYIGRPVCAVLHDGSHVYGVLGGCDGTTLTLNPYTGDGAGPGVLTTKSFARKTRQSKKATTSAFGFPFNPFVTRTIALELALIAFLFAIPFFFI